jgi:hypothetical protein
MQKSLQINNLSIAATSATLVFALALGIFFAFEPAVTLGQTVDEFTVQGEITGELAFVTTADDVTLSPQIPGLTGGFATGATTVAVNTNNPTGYSMGINFSEVTALQQDLGTSTVPNYIPAAGTTPDYDFIMAAGAAGFGFSVFSETNPGDADSKFLSDNETCGTGAIGTLGKCWTNTADATNEMIIINRPSPTPSSGATTTVSFQVGLGSNPDPALPAGFYTATTTLTITEN